MTSLFSSTPYPPFTLAYPHLSQMLDSLLSAPVSSPSSTFTLPTSTVMSTVSANTSPYSSTLPPTPSLLSSANFSATHSSFAPLPLSPQEAVATSSHLQEFAAVRQLTHDLQQRKPRHSKRLQLPPGETGISTKHIVHTAVYKQKLTQYNNALKLYEQYITQLLSEQATELNRIYNNVNSIVKNLKNPSKLLNFKSPAFKTTQFLPLRIHTLSDICYNCFQCYPLRWSHLPHNHCTRSFFPLSPSSLALIPIKVESITPPTSQNSLNDLTLLMTSLQDDDYCF